MHYCSIQYDYTNKYARIRNTVSHAWSLQIAMCEFCQRGKGFRLHLPELRCFMGSTYDLPEDYILIDYSRLSFRQMPALLFDVQKAYRYVDDFVEKMKTTKAPNPRSTWGVSPVSNYTNFTIPPKHTNVVVVEVEDLSLEGCKVYAPTHIPLLQHAAENQRIVFTQSYKRHDYAFLSREVSRDTIFVLVVNASEERKYREKWGKFLAVLVLPDGISGIGSVRHHILRIAQAWNLHQCWVVDDSITPNSLQQIIRCGEIQTFLPLSFEQMFSELEAEMDRGRSRNVCLIGPTSKYSVKNLSVSTSFLTRRAPTNIVLINVALCTAKGVQYDKRLRSKVYILFAYSCLAADCEVYVHRKYCYEDYPFNHGGVLASISDN